MYLFVFIFLQALSLSLSFLPFAYDEETAKVRDEFQKTIFDINNKGKGPYEIYSNSLPEPAEVMLPIESRPGDNLKAAEDLEKYVASIIVHGENTLMNTAKEIIKQITDVPDNITQEIYITTTDDYNLKIKNYYNYVAGERDSFFIDEEFIYLNMLDTSKKLLFKEQCKLVDAILSAVNKNNESVKVIQIDSNLYARIRNMSERIINKHTMKHESELLQYLCDKYDMCKPNPAFADSCEIFLKELTKLPSDKFTVLTEFVNNNVRENYEFLAMIRDLEGNPETMNNEIKSFYANTTIKDVLIAAEMSIRQRFTIIHTETRKTKRIIQAGRILLDIMDKTFHNTTVVEEMDAIVTDIKNWAYNEKPFPGRAIVQLISNLFKRLNSIRYPIKTSLIEVILRGYSSNIALDEILFLEGSKGVYGS